jgi:hypothetical protein
MSVLIFSTTSVWNISHSKKNSARCHKRASVFMLSTRYSRHISTKLEFLFFFFRKNKVPDFMKIRPVRTELFHADGQKDMTKLIVASRNFANAPEIGRRSFH